MRIDNSVVYIIISLFQIGTSFLIESTAIVAVSVIGYAFRCQFYECCNDNYINRNTRVLRKRLNEQLYGQHIARDIVFSAVHSHINHDNPKKPLVLSFHGVPGTGKNYVATIIAQTLFKNEDKSQFHYFFNGRHDFPLDRNVDFYKLDLKEKIDRALRKCERSLFVFDEVDKMPPGVLDVLVPFLDYTNWNYVKKSHSIFIFLSNTGSKDIVNQMIQIWESGKNRDDTTLQDFENLIMKGAFNEIGGLHKSGTIGSKLIDHYVPFLPLEEKHVKECIKDLFKHWNYENPSEKEIKEVLDFLTFGPKPHNLYSVSGCKTLDHKVSHILFGKELDDID